MKNNEINKSTDRGNFKTQWQRRQQWQEPARKTVPDDENFLRWAEKARQASAGPDVNVKPFPTHRRNRWIPYAAAASIAVGVITIGLIRHNETDTILPIAKEVNVNGQTIRFVCNNDCSVQDVIFAVNEVIKK